MRVNSEPRQPNMMPPMAAKTTAAPERRGATIIVDSFQSSTSHGTIVEGAAASLGSIGPSYRVSQHQQVQGRDSMPHVGATTQLQVQLSSESLSSQEAQHGLEQFVADAAAGNVQLATSLLKAVGDEGFENSVVNFSQGLDAILLMHLAKHPLSPKSKLSAQQQDAYRGNLNAALACDATTSEKQRDNLLLQQIKVNLTTSPQVLQAVEGWRGQVREFESNRNSVVVAAGNSGLALKGLIAAGFEIDGSEDVNVLAVPEVTTVGESTDGPNGAMSLAASSSFGPEIDLVASGAYQGHQGTSFASPKVANAMRAAHLSHPDFTSDEAEAWVKANLSHQGQIGNQPVAILDTPRASAFIQTVAHPQAS